MKSYYQISQIYTELNKTQMAIDCLENLYREVEQNLGKENWLYIKCLQLLGANLFKIQQFKKALQFSFYALKLALKYFKIKTQKNLLLQKIYNQIGKIMIITQELEQHASKYFISANNLSNPDNNDSKILLLSSAFNLGTIQEKNKNLKQAQNHYFYCASISKQLFSVKSKQLVETLNKIAMIFTISKQYSIAQKYYEKCVFLQKSEENYSYKNLSLALNNLAETCGYLNNYNKAKELYSQSLALLKNTQAQDWKEYINILNDMASLEASFQNEKASINNFKKAEKLLLKHQKTKQSVELAALYGNMGVVYYKLKEYKLSKSNFQKALKMYIKLLGEKNQYIAPINNWLQKIQNSRK